MEQMSESYIVVVQNIYPSTSLPRMDDAGFFFIALAPGSSSS
jgi:hypothetical protein